MGIDFHGKKVTLIGLGARTHIALAHYLVRHGAKVTISDIKEPEQLQSELVMLGELPVRLSLGSHRLEDILDAETVFVTPGAPRTLDCLREAQRHGIPITSEIELFFQLCPAPIIGITGSSGKTTTTALVGEMLRADGQTVYVGGNIGRPLIEEVETIRPQSWVVLELSSFQLEGLRQSPHLAAVLNITPDHLDRHRDMEEYIAAKRHIFSHQGPDNWAIFGYDDPIAAGLAEEARGYRCYFSLRERVEGTYLSGEDIQMQLADGERTIAKVDDVRLRGQHNLANVLAATALAAIAGTGDEAIRQAIRSFGELEHRLEPVTTSGTIRYFNDSIATSPHRTIAALRSFTEPIILLAGGRDKHLPLAELAKEIARHVKWLILYGESAPLLATAVEREEPAFTRQIHRCADLAEAVDEARRLAHSGDIILLSPAFPSFDQFRDFEERGRRFKQLVQES